MLKISLAVALMVGTLCPAVHAQTVVEASDAVLSAIIGRSPTGYDSCGVRAVVTAGTLQKVDAYDMSIAVRPEIFHGTMKAGKTTVDLRIWKSGDRIPAAITPAPTNFWIVRELEGKPLSPETIMPSSDAGYTLALGELVETYRVLHALLAGERMQFAVRYANESSDSVVAFSAKLPAAQAAAVQACIKDVFEQLKAANSKK